RRGSSYRQAPRCRIRSRQIGGAMPGSPRQAILQDAIPVCLYSHSQFHPELEEWQKRKSAAALHHHAFIGGQIVPGNHVPPVRHVVHLQPQMPVGAEEVESAYGGQIEPEVSGQTAVVDGWAIQIFRLAIERVAEPLRRSIAAVNLHFLMLLEPTTYSERGTS